jgi:hypothetical protein
MTLREFVETLPEPHRARRELDELENRLRQAEAGYWGSPCENHSNIAGLLATVPVDADGDHCFTCWVEAREQKAREPLQKMISCEKFERDCAGTEPDPPDVYLSRCLMCQILYAKKQRDEAAEKEREHWARVAEKLEHPTLKESGDKTKREKFYQTHIIHAWKQAGHWLAKKIRANEEERDG